MPLFNSWKGKLVHAYVHANIQTILHRHVYENILINCVNNSLLRKKNLKNDE